MPPVLRAHRHAVHGGGPGAGNHGKRRGVAARKRMGAGGRAHRAAAAAAPRGSGGTGRVGTTP